MSVPSLGRYIGLAVTLIVALVPTSASAVTGSQAGSPQEAPWMVKLSFTFPNAGPSSCSGEIIAHGLVLTAAHCVSQHRCETTVSPTRIRIRFADKRGLVTKKPAKYIRRAGFKCGDQTPALDLATIRFPDGIGRPSLPIASAAQIAGFSDRGVTAFAGGYYMQNAQGQWVQSSWTRKSRDGGLVLNPACQIAGHVCFRYAGSSIQGGDSGGALVGWLDGWKLLAVIDDAYQSLNIQIGSGASMADAAARAWVDAQVASAPQ